MGPFDGYVARVEVVGLSPLHAVPAEALQVVLREGGESVVGVEDVDVTGVQPRTLVELPGDRVAGLLHLV